MIKVKTMLMCETIIQDKETGNLTAINILENGTVKSSPIFFPQIAILAISERSLEDPRTVNCSLQLSLNKEKLFDQQVTLDYFDKLNNRVVVRILGFVLPKPGILKATLKLGRKTIGSCEVKLELIKPEVIVKQVTPPQSS